MIANETPAMIATKKTLHDELIAKLCEERMDRLMADVVEAAIANYETQIARAEAAVVHLADEDDDNVADSGALKGARGKCDKVLRAIPPTSQHDAVTGSQMEYLQTVAAGMS